MATYVPGRCPLCNADACPAIDSTPPFPKPPEDQIRSAAADVVAIMANRWPIGEHKRIEWYAGSVAATLQKEFGHTLAAGAWAVEEMVGEGHLSAHSSFSANHSPKPAYENITVRAEPTLWKLWRDSESSRTGQGNLPASFGEDIDALLVKKDSPDLSHAQVAAAIGVNRTVIYNRNRFQTYHAYCDKLEADAAQNIRRGFKDSDGRLEAIYE